MMSKVYCTNTIDIDCYTIFLTHHLGVCGFDKNHFGLSLQENIPNSDQHTNGRFSPSTHKHGDFQIKASRVHHKLSHIDSFETFQAPIQSRFASHAQRQTFSGKCSSVTADTLIQNHIIIFRQKSLALSLTNIKECLRNWLPWKIIGVW